MEKISSNIIKVKTKNILVVGESKSFKTNEVLGTVTDNTEILFDTANSVQKTSISKVRTRYISKLFKTSLVSSTTISKVIPNKFSTGIVHSKTQPDIAVDYEDIIFSTKDEFSTDIIKSSTKYLSKLYSTSITSQKTNKIVDDSTYYKTNIIKVSTKEDLISDYEDIIFSTKDHFVSNIIKGTTKYISRTLKTDVIKVKTESIPKPDLFKTNIISAITNKDLITDYENIIFSSKDHFGTEIVKSTTKYISRIYTSDIIKTTTQSIPEPDLYNTSIINAVTEQDVVNAFASIIFDVKDSMESGIIKARTDSIVQYTNIIKQKSGIMTFYLLFKIDNNIYYYSRDENVFKLMEDRLDKHAFNKYGIADIHNVDFSQFDDKQIKVLSYDPETVQQHNYLYQLNSVPFDQVILSNGDITVEDIDTLNEVTSEYVLDGQGMINIVVSNDNGNTWLGFDNGWVDYNFDNPFINSIPINEIKDIPEQFWTNLVEESSNNTLRFSYIITQNSYNDQAINKAIIINTDLKGRWKKQRQNVDFSYVYSSKELKIELYKNGTYKINYQGCIDNGNS